jgi:hypothetical protein
LETVKNTAVSNDQSELAGAAADFYIYERIPNSAP